jgi:predicted permease
MLRSLWLRIRKRRQLERDLQDELAYHREMRQANLRAFGNSTLIHEEIREMWSFVHVENLWRDARHAVRVLLRAPGHTAAIVALLAVGIGSNAAIFTLFNAVFIRPLAVDRPQELVILTRIVNGNPSGWSSPGLEEFHSRQTSFGGLFAMSGGGPVSMDPTSEAPTGQSSMVSGNFFQVLGVHAALGRVFAEADDQPESPNFVVVLSDGFWRNYLGGEPGVVGRTVYLYRRPFTVIGVTPREFVGLGESLWVPLSAVPIADPDYRELFRSPRPWATVMGRLKPGVSIRQAQAEADVVYPQTPANTPETPSFKTAVSIEPGSRGLGYIEKQYGTSLRVLMAAVGLLLLIACANVGSLLLARSGSRQRETAVRLALGCGRKRLIRQFLIESLVLAASGCALGLAFASWGMRVLLASILPGVALPIDISLDVNVLVFTVGASGVAAILFGLGPALRASSIGIEPALKGASQTATGSRSRQSLNRCFVAAQVALSVVLVAGSVLFGQSLYRLHSTAGFDAKNVVTAVVGGALPLEAGEEQEEQWVDLAQRLTERISGLPHVKSVSVASDGVTSGWKYSWSAAIEGAPESWGPPHVDTVSANFLDTFGIPVVAGRGFSAEDRKGAPAVSVVNETFARAYFPGENALGKHFSVKGNPNPINIVGITRDLKLFNLRQFAQPVAYVTFEQFPSRFSTVHFQVDGSVPALLPLVRNVLTGVNPKLRPYQLETFDDRLNRSITQDIWLARLTSLFGTLALGLACFGVYGVISYLVVSRTTEIGIRLAVGAQPGRVLRQVIGDALKTVAPGVVLGIGIAIGSERFIVSLLYGAKARDPLTYGAVAACLLMTTALAAYLPARRASKIDPVDALRCE